MAGRFPLWLGASRRERRQRNLIDKFLTFRKNSLMIWSPEGWFIPPWFARRTQTVVDPRTAILTAIRGHMRQLHILTMILIPTILFRQRRSKRKRWQDGLRGRNPLKKLNSRKKGAWILLRLAWIFLPQAWIFLPPLRAQRELSGPTELDEQQREFDFL